VNDVERARINLLAGWQLKEHPSVRVVNFCYHSCQLLSGVQPTVHSELKRITD